MSTKCTKKVHFIEIFAHLVLVLHYSTLLSCPFGAFPALPTLDVQYCSQIKLLCRDNMISSLLNSAKELEQFAREAEYACAILIQALRPTFNYYKLDAPPLPKPVPLSAYPLDFEPPECKSFQNALKMIISIPHFDT